jgi:hypothetical protein
MRNYYNYKQKTKKQEKSCFFWMVFLFAYNEYCLRFVLIPGQQKNSLYEFLTYLYAYTP